jgi:NAD+ kinase
VVVDGQIRRIVGSGRIVVRRSRYDAAFIRPLGRIYSLLDKKLKDRVVATPKSPINEKLPPSCKLILKVLEYEGPLSTKELIYKSGLPPRTVNYALKILLGKDLIVREKSSKDARQSIYMINPRE